MKQPSYETLLSNARARDDLLALVFAGVISLAIAADRRPIIRGLSENRFRRLLNEYFPEVEIENGAAAKDLPDADVFAGLVSLLLDNRIEPTEQRAWLSYAIASSAMGHGLLWQEMGLPAPHVLGDVMLEHFPALAAANSDGREWKAFLHGLRSERAGEVL